MPLRRSDAVQRSQPMKTELPTREEYYRLTLEAEHQVRHGLPGPEPVPRPPTLNPSSRP
jgi:hypothetical protein